MHRIDLKNIKEDKLFQEKFGMEEGEEFSPLGQGEYNINYRFKSKFYKQNLVLRIASKSQMALKEQITYEYSALKLLETTGRTPEAIYLDDRKKLIPYGFLVMEYLPGEPLDYKADLKTAAEILADIHNTDILKENGLLCPKDPVGEIYKECRDMFNRYKTSEYKNEKIQAKIETLLEKGKNIKTEDIGRRTIINTELNSGNFLINKGAQSYLIDWEKPIFAYAAQDLGHFLAPTTTYWKTDDILSKEEIYFFIDEYCKGSNQYKDERELLRMVKSYIAINCLRGITWCAMAYAEYQDPDKLIVNDYTYKKIQSYLSEEFLRLLDKEYLDGY